MRRLGAVAAALIATLSCAQPADAATVPWHYRTPQEASYSVAVFDLMNRERAAHALQSLWRCRLLRHAGRHHNFHMAEANELSHQLPGEPWFGQREINAGYYWVWAGENIAWTSDMSLAGVLRLERLMYGETAPDNGHRLNILGAHYRAVGIDVWLDTVHQKLWLTTDFGRRY